MFMQVSAPAACRFLVASSSAQMLCQPACVSLNQMHRHWCTSDTNPDEGSTRRPAIANPFTAMALIWCSHVDVGALRTLGC